MAVAQQPTARHVASHNSIGAQDAMFRRVAIVLSSLPAHMSNRLLSSLSPETRSSLRQEMRDLSDVDPLERQRAFLAFKGSVIEQHQMNSESLSHAGDTYSSSTTALHGESTAASRVYRTNSANEYASRDDRRDSGHSPRSTFAPVGNASVSGMGFLADIEDDVLARVMADEHPQAIALVLASIAPAQAARIVATLHPGLQSEALNRIARLDEASSEVLMDFAEHLRAKVGQFGSQSFTKGGSYGGQSALRAILDAMPKADAFNIQENLANDRAGSRSENQVLAERAAMVDEVLSPRRHSASVSDTADQGTTQYAEDDADPSVHSIIDHGIGHPTTSPQGPQLSSISINPFSSTDAIHHHLVQLAPQELCRALAEVETRQALLALCGLPNKVADGVLAALPRSQAKQVRAKLASLGNMQLREIDEAKELVALASVGFQPAGSNQVQPIASAPARMSTMPVAA